MNLDAVRAVAEAALAGRRPNGMRETGYIYYHGLRVANLAGELSVLTGGADSFDPVMYVGGLFHDTGKGFPAHHETGAAIVRNLLADHCTQEDLDAVCRIVQYHCIRKHGLDLPRSVLLVQDADIVDHYGTQEVWLKFLYAAGSGEAQPTTAEYWRGEDYLRNIEQSRSLLNFPESVALFDERIAYQNAFYRRFEREARGEIVDEGETL